MSKQLFIHIGLPKTGTTAIQSTLLRNCDALLKQGILYPKSGMYQYQHGLLCLYLNTPHQMPKTHAIHSMACYQKCWPDFIEEATQSPAQKIVLSAEGFSFIKDINSIKKIAEYCRVFEVKIILYLRRQDQFLQALYNQNIKHSHYQGTSDVEKFLGKSICKGDFKSLLNHWAACFGQENILIRLYEKAQLPNGLVNDFMSLIECDDTHFDLPERTNPSLPPRYIEVIKLLNRESSLSPEKHRRLINTLHACSVKNKSITTHSLFSPQQCHDIMERFLVDNEEIARKYLHRKDGVLFREPLPNLEEPWQQEQSMSPEEIITELLLPYITKNGTKPLTVELVVKELLAPLLKITMPRARKKVSFVKWLYYHVRLYGIKQTGIKIYKKINQAV